MKRFLSTLLLAAFLLAACNRDVQPEKDVVSGGLETTPKDTQVMQTDVVETTIVTETLPIENPVTVWVRTLEEEYDHSRNQTTTTSTSYNQNGDYILQVRNREDEEIARSEYEYDAAGRLQKITYFFEGVVDQTTQYTYDTDAYSIAFTYYNKKGKEIARSVTIYANDGSWSKNIDYDGEKEYLRSSVKYDSNGNLVERIEYASGVEASVTTYSYDDFGNNILTVHTANGVEAYRFIYTYDANNRLTEYRSIQDGKEKYTTYVYDISGNLIEVYQSNGGELILDSSYSYDGCGNLLERISYHTNVELQDSTTTERFEYDQDNNCIAKHTFSDSEKGSSFYYVYDENNNLLHSEKIGADGVVKMKTTYVYSENNLTRTESFKNGEPEKTTEMTWVEMTVSEEKAEELFRNNGTDGDYRFEAAFLQKMEESGITCPLDS